MPVRIKGSEEDRRIMGYCPIGVFSIHSVLNRKAIQKYLFLLIGWVGNVSIESVSS
jgi:hypothetical protein